MTPSRNLRVIIVDDEPLARKRIERGVHHFGQAEIVGSAGNGRDAIELVRTVKPDVILLDVRMPGEVDGFGLLDHISKDDPPIVIFVTAFDEYAVRAFNAAALDYVLKPVDFGRLAEALRRAQDTHGARIAKERAQELENVVAALRDRDAATASRFAGEFWVRTGGDFVRVRVGDIDWVEAERDYARLHVGARSYLHELSLGELEKELDPKLFVRIHRSALIRRNALATIRKQGFRGVVAQLANGAEVPIGRTYVAKIKRELACTTRSDVAIRRRETADTPH